MAPSKPRKTLSRKLPSGEYKKALEKHLNLVGGVVWGWSELHKAFGFAFIELARTATSLVANEMWQSIPSDHQQRKALSNILPYACGAKVRRCLDWAIKETDQLSQYRNDIVHGARGWSITRHGLKPRFSTFGNKLSVFIRYADRETDADEILPGPDLDQLMVLLRGDLMMLSQYVSEVARNVSGSQPTLPHRPLLLARKYARRPEIQTAPKRRKRRTRPKSPPA